MNNDTIAAIATPPGEGGISVLRISGPQAVQVAGRIFRPRHGTVEEFAGYTVHYGELFDPASDSPGVVDDGLLTVFRAPNSYTAEDVCEIGLHGGSATPARAVELVLRAGARMAGPGEFTQRAFLNGRIDLAQAEAVSDLIRSRTETARRAARRQLSGDLSRAVEEIRDDLIGIIAAIEVTIDFSDEVGELNHADIAARLEAVRSTVAALRESYGRGKVLRSGLSVAIVGSPNVGKSSLLNAMLRCERAIVTSIPGTTRDTIEESVVIDGLPVVLTDTAGIRETADTVEQIGVQRSKIAVSSSDVALLVLDASAGVTAQDREVAAAIREAPRCIIALNKSDLISSEQLERVESEAASELGLPAVRVVAVSALCGQGIDDLEEVITAPYAAVFSADPAQEVVVTSERHKLALDAAVASMDHSAASAYQKMPGDFITIDARGALDALGEITGETAADDIISRIFRDFCVGK